MKYLKYVIKRIFISLVTIFAIIVITFFLTRAIPGDPVWRRLPSKASYEDYLRERKRLGLDQPVIVQFFIYMQDFFTGNWGISLTVQEDVPIWELVNVHLPRTIEIMIISMIIAIFFGIKLGKISASHKNSKRDVLIRILTYLFISMPGFVVVIFIMQLNIYTPFKILPMFGIKSPRYPEPPTITHFRILDCLISKKIYLLVDYLWHLIVPVSTMVIVQMVAIIRHTRSSVLDVLQMDFVRTAEAKGCSRKKIMKKHVLKNSLPPVITVSAMGFPIVLGGMVAVEVIYNFPGMGFLFYLAVRYDDYNLIITLIFVFALTVIIFNFLADIINAAIDPRIKLK